ncbi:uncharacterized protein VTP21DRAFT_3147 [Calcarisporiella thermophila]|uniref:uncharacterized protein n=1 Tax=Calcarisporiella thermophila TaxID=911321 RepID=UPI003741F117
MVAKKDDDFVMTIDEEEDIPYLEEENEDLEEDEEANQKKSNKKKKESKAAKKKGEDADGLDPNFTFDIGGGAHAGPLHAWDFKEARALLKEKATTSALDIDEIIERKRTSNKSKGKNDKKKQDKTATKEPTIDDDDEDIAADGFGGGASDEELEEAHEFVDLDSEEDEEEGSAGEDENLEGDEEEENDEVEDEDEDEDEEDDEEDDDEDDEENEDDDDDDDENEEEDEYEKERKKEYFAPEAENPDEIHESFASMNLSRPIMKGLTQVGFVQPTSIQAKTIPVALLGKDICGSAVTGSGKTAAFIVPILERLLYRPRQAACTRVLILCPTRELAIQCHSVAVKLASYTDIGFCLCVGGLSLKTQEAQLRQKPDVIIATPGRLIDHVRNSMSVTLDEIDILVMDEADRMLEEGFAAELNEIVKACPKSRQTMLFSATMTDNVDELIRLSLNRPVRLFVDPTNAAASRLVQEFVRIRQHREADRAAVLLALCKKSFKHRVIIFFRSKAAAHQMKIAFGLLGLRAAELHGNLTQEQRLKALEEFRDEQVDYLLATDLASRGLDIKGIETVINFNMPQQFAQYLHRVGRTARAGRAGRSVTLVGEGDRKLLRMAVKSAPKEQIKQRVVSPDLVSKYREKLESLQDQIREVMQEEKEEKALRQAEMEVRKSQNLLTHEAEIYSRPARTWFQSEKEKQQSKEIGKAHYNAQFEPAEDKKRKRGEEVKRDKYAGLSRKKRRRLQILEEEKAEARSVGNLKAIRAVKKAARPTKIGKVRESSAGRSVSQSSGGATKKGGFEAELTDFTKRRAGANVQAVKKSKAKMNAKGGKGKAKGKVGGGKKGKR